MQLTYGLSTWLPLIPAMPLNQLQSSVEIPCLRRNMLRICQCNGTIYAVEEGRPEGEDDGQKTSHEHSQRPTWAFLLTSIINSSGPFPARGSCERNRDSGHVNEDNNDHEDGDDIEDRSSDNVDIHRFWFFYISCCLSEGPSVKAETDAVTSGA